MGEKIKISKGTPVVSDRDIKRKAIHANFLAVDIKKGEPFFPVDVNDRFICVPEFGGPFNQYPIEWFSVHNPERELWVTEVQESINLNEGRRSIRKLYDLFKSGKLALPRGES